GTDENTMDDPMKVVPRLADVTVTGEGGLLRFPVAPFSVNIITAKLK
ncbi:MAG: hypothetical protein HUK02_08420, partial [Bacteroidaceae bacterium]|nr:hypothetical protein [Bacteroidaceae bacterium]